MWRFPGENILSRLKLDMYKQHLNLRFKDLWKYVNQFTSYFLNPRTEVIKGTLYHATALLECFVSSFITSNPDLPVYTCVYRVCEWWSQIAMRSSVNTDPLLSHSVHMRTLCEHCSVSCFNTVLWAALTQNLLTVESIMFDLILKLATTLWWATAKGQWMGLALSKQTWYTALGATGAVIIKLFWWDWWVDKPQQ